MATPEILTVIAAVGVLITGIGAVIVNIIVALRQTTTLKEVASKVADISAKADVITGHVNSASTAAQEKIASLTSQVIELTRLVDNHQKTAELLAQSVSHTTPVPTPFPIKIEK